MKSRMLSYVVPLVLAGAFNAHADGFTVSAAGVSGYVSGSHSGSFDLNAVLSPASAYPLPLDISSAIVTFNFSDDAGDAYGSSTQNAGASIGSYYSTGSYYDGSNYHYTYYRDVRQFYTTTQTEQGEAAQLLMGSGNALVGTGQTATALVGSSTNTANTGTAFDYQTGSAGYYSYYSCGFFNMSTCSTWNPGTFQDYYTKNSTQTTTNSFSTTGTFSIVSDITSNASLLDELMTTGMLPFQLNLSGDAVLTSVTLQVMAMPVPEADTYAMLLAGLGLVGAAARRRRAAWQP